MSQVTSDELEPTLRLLIQLAGMALAESMAVQDVLTQHAPDLAQHLPAARKIAREKLGLDSIDPSRSEKLLSLLKAYEGPLQ